MENKMEKIISLCKRRGFIFPGSEIYGGLANTWDYGPFGVQLKNNIQNMWWKRFVESRADVYGLNSAILMNPRVWEASGHVAGFNDALVDCKSCKARLRADHLIEDQLDIKTEGKSVSEMDAIIKKGKIKCPNCGKKDFTDARAFNLLFKTFIGPVEHDASVVYMRGETAQGMFVNFKNIVDTMHPKLPFGIAQVGKSFRNEITPGNFTFRTLEFEQMEIEYFVEKENWKKSFTEWQKEMERWLQDLGIDKKNYKIREHDKTELSHYSKKTIDFEYHFPFGWKELYGLAYRTDFDLAQHQEYSKKDLEYRDGETEKKFLPHVIEPTFGLDRTLLMILLDAYHEEDVKGENRVVMKFNKQIAPVQVAILPLSKKPELSNEAKAVFQMLQGSFRAMYDETGSIGKRYRRQDEIGTPYCITFDFESLEDKSVTVRDRDSMKQERIRINELEGYLRNKF
ncbi:glycine--tRNA ligase [Candidatus Parcubacteria bacterium]|nr:glycine--tRNA ligase [Candidatus Parcubacteria bacterium]